MAVPALHLDLAPQPSLWRQQHVFLGWASLGLGSLLLAGSLGLTWRAYHQAGRAGRDAVNLAAETRRAARQQQELQATLQAIDATKEQARWKLAERILQERSLPWSRLTAELERCMVPDMRLRSIQRVRGAGQQVVMKLKGEARTVPAENAFIGALRSAPVFEQVVLEREAERQGGGWDFELTLPVAAVPPPFSQEAPAKAPVAKVSGASPARAPEAPAPSPAPVKPSPTRPAPARPAPEPRPAALTAPVPVPGPAGAAEGVVAKPAPEQPRFHPTRRRPAHREEGGAE